MRTPGAERGFGVTARRDGPGGCVETGIPIRPIGCCTFDPCHLHTCVAGNRGSKKLLPSPQGRSDQTLILDGQSPNGEATIDRRYHLPSPFVFPSRNFHGRRRKLQGRERKPGSFCQTAHEIQVKRRPSRRCRTGASRCVKVNGNSAQARTPCGFNSRLFAVWIFFYGL